MNDRPLLSRTECNALRGIAILGIFLHNYCHWLNFAVKENEYTFSQHNVDWLWQVIERPDQNFLIQIISFFGHYGVPVFLFLSAYGLVQKYEQRDDAMPSVWQFIRYHFLKLFRMMIVGYVAFTLVDAATPHPRVPSAVNILGQLALVNNFFPEPDHAIWPGPYWFFGLMLQLYVLYRVVFYRRHWGVVVGAMLLFTLVQWCFVPDGEGLNYYRYNSLGSILPFGLGLLFARYGHLLHFSQLRRRDALAVFLLTSFLLLPFSQSFALWMWMPVVVCVWSVSLIKMLPTRCVGDLSWVGSISAALFVIHPVARKIFIPYSHHGNVMAGLLLYIISSIALAWLLREFMKKIPQPHANP